MTFKSFEEIDAWKEARKLQQWIRVVCKRPSVKRDWVWVDQSTRAVISIMANIAEGNESQTYTEFILFLGYAKRSTAEVRSHLYYALDEKYITKEECADAADRTKKISAQLANLIQYLRTCSSGRKNMQRVTCNV